MNQDPQAQHSEESMIKSAFSFQEPLRLTGAPGKTYTFCIPVPQTIYYFKKYYLGHISNIYF